MYTLALFAVISSALAAPVIKVDGADAIAGKWIVKLKGDMTSQGEDDLRTSMSTKPDHEYAMPGFRGFAGSISDEGITQLQASEHVEYIQQDAKVHTYEVVQELNATWGLARISHAEPYQTTYLYDSSAGEGTCAYVIDTGIEIEHPEFQGRAFFLKDFTNEGTMIDGQGHGTHVAGTIGSVTWGVAKKTTLLAVRVLDSLGFGTTAGVLAGMNYVITDAKARRDAGQCRNGIVANMSLGGRRLQAMNDAAAAIVASEIFLGVAAGNEGMPADYASPASEPTACTVGATAFNDTLIEWSNYGPRVDILAPGVDITSIFIGGGIEVYSGTYGNPACSWVSCVLFGSRTSSGRFMRTPGWQQGAIDESTLPEGTPNLLAFNKAASSSN